MLACLTRGIRNFMKVPNELTAECSVPYSMAGTKKNTSMFRYFRNDQAPLQVVTTGGRGPEVGPRSVNTLTSALGACRPVTRSRFAPCIVPVLFRIYASLQGMIDDLTCSCCPASLRDGQKCH
jgi:L-lysine 2,3-aminomutase